MPTTSHFTWSHLIYRDVECLAQVATGRLPGQRRHRAFLTLYTIYLSYSLRLWVYAYLAAGQRLATYHLQDYDFWITLANEHHLQIDPLLFLSVSGIPVFLITAHYLIYYSPDWLIWRPTYEYIVVNRLELQQAVSRDYFNLIKGNLKTILRNPIHTMRVFHQNVIILYNGAVQFKSKQQMPKLMPHLSIQRRTQILLLVALFEWAIMAAFGVIGALVAVMFSLNYQHRHNLALLFQLLDILLITFATLVAFKTFLFTTCAVIIFQLTTVWAYHQQNATLAALIRSNWNTSAYYHHLRQYQQAHTSLIVLNLHVNDQLASKGLFAFFVTNVFSNIYIIVFLHFKDMPPLDRLLVSTIWCLQVLGPLVLVSCVIRINEHISLSNGNLLKVLTRPYYSITVKWKLATYYELLHRDLKPLKLTAGPLGELSKYAIFKFATFYAVYILFFCQMFLHF